MKSTRKRFKAPWTVQCRSDEKEKSLKLKKPDKINWFSSTIFLSLGFSLSFFKRHCTFTSEYYGKQSALKCDRIRANALWKRRWCISALCNFACFLIQISFAHGKWKRNLFSVCDKWFRAWNFACSRAVYVVWWKHIKLPWANTEKNAPAVKRSSLPFNFLKSLHSHSRAGLAGFLCGKIASVKLHRRKIHKFRKFFSFLLVGVWRRKRFNALDQIQNIY